MLVGRRAEVLHLEIEQESIKLQVLNWIEMTRYTSGKG